MTGSLSAPLTGPNPFDPLRAAGFKIPKRPAMKRAAPTGDGLVITLPGAIGVKNGWSLNAGFPDPPRAAEVACVSRIEPGFPSGRGGKNLPPGLDNRGGGKTWSGGVIVDVPGGFSARWMWRDREDRADENPATDPGRIWLHAYYYKFGGAEVYGATHRYVLAGEWHAFKITASVDTGRAEWFLDGERVFAADFGAGGKPIQTMTFDCFRGGSSSEWKTKKPGSIVIRDLEARW